jgi:HD superfamily phosphohydrolase
MRNRPKDFHEIRDPLHVFVRVDSDERRILDSRPLQRLRHIHQLALSSLVYPGATHKRFEHSLGVMELAGRVFDVVTAPENVAEEIREVVPGRGDQLAYWRKVVRLAALCHDIGHLPFSHAAEAELLPEGWNHERLTGELLKSGEMREVLDAITPPIRVDDVIKLAVGPKKASHMEFTTWETLLAEVIVGDAFGVDRVDYLLRDSFHSGVAYGRFDHFRLLDTLRILPRADGSGGSAGPGLGIELGGIQSAEALLIARYFMYSQVYFHPVRRAYDLHLRQFLSAWLPGGRFSTDCDAHLAKTDNEVTVAMRAAAFDPSLPGHEPARRVLCRQHFRVLYQRNPGDQEMNPGAVQLVGRAARAEFGSEDVAVDAYGPKGAPALDFPVALRDGRVVSSLAESEALNHLPTATFGYVLVSPERATDATQWLNDARTSILSQSDSGGEQ